MSDTPQWALDQLETQAHEVRCAPMGAGHTTLIKAAFSLGRLVPHILSRAEVESRLLRVVTQEWERPLSERQARVDIASMDKATPWFPSSTPKAMRIVRAPVSTAAVALKPSILPSEFGALLSRCLPVDHDDEVSAWLTRCGMSPERVAERRIAYALPSTITRKDFPWATCAGRGWAESGHRLIVPLRDAAGAVRSLVARAVVTDVEKKSLAAPCSRAGCVMIDWAARAVLMPGSIPAHDDEPWFADAPPAARRIIIVEGEKKFCLHATASSDAAQYAPAVVGTFSGSWSQELGDLIPDGWTVVVRTDPDKSGALYATKIVRSLAQRVLEGRLSLELRESFELAVDAQSRFTVRLAHAA